MANAKVVFFSGFVLAVCLHGTLPAKPTLEEIEKVQCEPGKDICLYHGQCCTFGFEWCSNRTRSCDKFDPFPKGATEEYMLGECCKSMMNNTLLMKYCLAKFGLKQTCSKDRLNEETTATLWTTQLPEHPSKTCAPPAQGDSSCAALWITAVCCVIGLIILIGVVIHYYLRKARKCSEKRKDGKNENKPPVCASPAKKGTDLPPVCASPVNETTDLNSNSETDPLNPTYPDGHTGEGEDIPTNSKSIK